ncbi:MAG: hypothetical protein BGO11_02680 [Solirubrobacterales bacterium 70-9]|nr:MAG: hypothetical protein BGO11_02680 [Solirubrobacterales bacterium 70-9]
MLIHRKRPTLTAATASIVLALLALIVAPTALAAPVKFEQAATGASVTIDSGRYVAGERIEIEGAGFTPASGTTGQPLVAVKVDKAAVAWAFGGADAYTGTVAGASIWFEAADDGTFEGWIEIPTSFVAGEHTLYFLSGTASTGDKKTTAISVSGPVAVTAPPTASLSATSAQVGDTLTLTVSGWTAEAGGGQKVALKIDAGATLGCVQTDSEGNGVGTVTVPAGTEPGEHAVRLLAGSECVSGSGVLQPPARSQALSLTVLATPTIPSGESGSTGTSGGGAVTTTPTPTIAIPAVRKAWIANGKLALTLAGGSGAKVKIAVQTATKVRLSPQGKKRVLTLARGTTRLLKGIARLPLTAAGRAWAKQEGPTTVKISLSSAAKTRVFRIKVG